MTAASAPERRPIAMRERGWAKGLANWLAARKVSPNAISVAGMIAGCLAGAVFAATNFLPEMGWLFFLAGILIQLRLLANMLDGMVAIAAQRTSPVGELYNEVPDRVSDAAVCIGAGYALRSCPELGYLAACVALFVAYVRAMGKAAGAPHDYRGPLAKPQRMFVLTLAAIADAVVPLASNVGLPAWLPQSATAFALLVIVLGGAVTAIRRVRGSARYLAAKEPA